MGRVRQSTNAQAVFTILPERTAQGCVEWVKLHQTVARSPHREVEACSEAVESAGADCKSLIKTCMDFLVSHGPEMKDCVTVDIWGISRCFAR